MSALKHTAATAVSIAAAFIAGLQASLPGTLTLRLLADSKTIRRRLAAILALSVATGALGYLHHADAFAAWTHALADALSPRGSYPHAPRPPGEAWFDRLQSLVIGATCVLPLYVLIMFLSILLTGDVVAKAQQHLERMAAAEAAAAAARPGAAPSPSGSGGAGPQPPTVSSLASAAVSATFAPPRAPGPLPALARSTALPYRRSGLFSALEDAVFRQLLVLLLTVSTVVVELVLPRPLGYPASCVLGAVLYAYTALDVRWGSAELPLQARFALVEACWAWCIGFGLPIAVASSYASSFVVNGSLYCACLPLAMLQALTRGHEAVPAGPRLPLLWPFRAVVFYFLAAVQRLARWVRGRRRGVPASAPASRRGSGAGLAE